MAPDSHDLWSSEWGQVVALPVLLSIVYFKQIDNWLFIRNHRAELEREFGFQAEFIPVPGRDGEDIRVFAVTSVALDGRLGRAGVRAGDIPVGYKHGFQSGFYRSLWAVHNGTPVRIQVMATKTDLDPEPPAWREITLEPQD